MKKQWLSNQNTEIKAYSRYNNMPTFICPKSAIDTVVGTDALALGLDHAAEQPINGRLRCSPS